MYCVYKHTCPNGKVYIGITGQNPVKRWGNGNNYFKQKHFASAILKYGWENIKHEILFEGLTKDEACAKEKMLIELHKSNNPKYGYNLSSGGESGAAGVEVSEETKHKLSEARKGEKNCNFGKHLSESTKQKLMDWNKGRFSGEKHWNYGKRYSKDKCEELSKAHEFQKKKVLCVETGKVFSSLCEAEKATGASKGNICNSCRGKNRAGGYHWKYVKE